MTKIDIENVSRMLSDVETYINQMDTTIANVTINRGDYTDHGIMQCIGDGTVSYGLAIKTIDAIRAYILKAEK